MANKELLAWKRKKSEVEARIQQLEALRKQSVQWLKIAGENKTKLAWRRNDYLELEEKRKRLHGATSTIAQKLDQAKQEQTEIDRNISRLKLKKVKALSFAGILVLVLLAGIAGVFIEPGITGFTTAELIFEVEEEATVFAAHEDPIFTIVLAEKKSNLLTGSAIRPPADKHINVSLTDPGGRTREVELGREIIETEEGFILSLKKGRQFQAGLYTLTATTTYQDRAYVQEQNFSWGVLALNVDKSIYLPNEDAFIGIAVLDNQGHMVCDADVTLEITDPLNNKEILSTENNKIKISRECEVYGVTELPDYYTEYEVGGIGTYKMELTAVTRNGVRSIEDSFIVQDAVDFDVARQGPTRIYPVALYTMGFTVHSNQDYDGLIKEYIPASFEITPQENLIITTVGDAKVLSWNVDLRKGDTIELYYEFDAPDLSPEFYLSGPLHIGSFAEKRNWQIASDAPAKLDEAGVFGCSAASIAVGETVDCGDMYKNVGDAFGVTCNVYLEDDANKITNTCGANNFKVNSISINAPGVSCSAVGDGSVNCVNWPAAADNEGLTWTLEGCSESAASIIDTNSNCNNVLGAGQGSQATVGVTSAAAAVKDLISVDVINTSSGSSTQGGGFVVSSTDGKLTNGTSLTYAAFDPTGLSRLNLSSIININISLIANGTHGGYVNVTFGWMLAKSNGSTMLNTTMYNNTINQTLWNHSFDTNLLAEGIYNISVYVQNMSTDVPFSPDIVVNYSRGFDIAIDRTPPTITNFWMNHSNASNFSSSLASKLLFNATINDTTLSVQEVRFGFYNGNATGFNVTTTKNTTLWAGEIVPSVMSDGIYTVRISANDTIGNRNNTIANISFTLDRTPPYISNFWMNHSNASNFSSSLVSKLIFNATINDTTLSVQEVRFGFYNSNATGFNVTATKNSTLWAAEVVPAVMSDGIYTVRISANDTVDNRDDTIANITFTVDRTPPNVSTFFMNTSDGTEYNQGANTVIVINATLNDSLTTVQEVTFGFLNDGNNSQFNITATKQGSYWYTNLSVNTLSAGLHTIRLYGNDSVGNVNDSVANLSFNILAPNIGPNITFVSNISAVSIIEGGSRRINFSFLASDFNGRGDLDNTSAQVRISLTGEADRFNTSCTPLATVGSSINYSCSVDVWYFDGAGFWTVNASIRDNAGSYIENASVQFTVQETTAFAIGPSALAWPTLELGTTNRTSNNDPITLNNTGNKDVATAGISLTGYNLRGLTTTSEFINAPNFSVSNLNGTSSCSGIACLECNGTIMANATIETLPNAILSAGNNSRNYQNDTSGQENLFFCLMTVPSEISRQTYDTSANQTAPWVITIT